MTTTHLLYLHGFRSSPKSIKASATAAWLAAHRPDITWWCPQLPPSPTEAMALIDAGIADWPTSTMAVIGSSLGGFYATAIAERTGCRAALLNPAVDPAGVLARHVDEPIAWLGELQTLTVPAITDRARYFTLIAKGDEVLDWREMRARYGDGPGLLLEGSDHAIGDYAALLPAVLAFVGCAAPSSG